MKQFGLITKTSDVYLANPTFPAKKELYGWALVWLNSVTRLPLICTRPGVRLPMLWVCSRGGQPEHGLLFQHSMRNTTLAKAPQYTHSVGMNHVSRAILDFCISQAMQQLFYLALLNFFYYMAAVLVSRSWVTKKRELEQVRQREKPASAFSGDLERRTSHRNGDDRWVTRAVECGSQQYLGTADSQHPAVLPCSTPHLFSLEIPHKGWRSF